MKARSEGVRDNRELLLLFATFSETRFEKIISFQDTQTKQVKTIYLFTEYILPNYIKKMWQKIRGIEGCWQQIVQCNEKQRGSRDVHESGAVCPT